MEDIQALADRIVRGFLPERIVLFGSYAFGTASPDSDVDLLVVLPYQGKSWAKAAEIRGRVRPRFPLDLLVRTPQQVLERLEMGDSFLRDVSDRGTVLDEARHG